MSDIKWDAEDEDYFDRTVKRDIAMVGRKKTLTKTLKTTVSEGGATQVVEAEKKAAKEVLAMQKILGKQTEFLKTVFPLVSHLADLMQDAEQRMEADTLDDVYGISTMKVEFKKLAASINKFIPKEETKIETTVLKQQVAAEAHNTITRSASTWPQGFNQGGLASRP